MFESIRNNITDLKYKNTNECPSVQNILPTGYITDKDKSAEWNSLQVLNSVLKYNEQFKKYSQGLVKSRELFEQDVIKYMKEKFEFKEAAIRFLLGEACEKEIEHGYEAVLNELEDLIEIVDDFNKLNK